MIPVATFQNQRVALFGLGGSGLATAHALMRGGAEVVAWDDNDEIVENARKNKIICQDLRHIDLSGFAALVLAPGVPLTHPAPHWAVTLAKAANLPVIGDVELFQLELNALKTGAKFIAITGTNGKSTTTALITHILKIAGLNVQMGGNIGTAVLSLGPPSNETVYIVECSSYQIDLAPSLQPDIGILLNLTPDHLDRHGSMKNYVNIKARLIEASHMQIISVDDAYCRQIIDQLPEQSLPQLISTFEPVEQGYWSHNGVLIQCAGNTQTIVAKLDHTLSLPGKHNAQNALAAFACCSAFGLTDDQIQKGLDSFPGLAHRMERVGMRDTILFVNDSKATNADATAPALSSFKKIHWILGGVPKSNGIEQLTSLFDHVVKAYLIGEAASEFSGTLSAADVPFEICQTLERAVIAANQNAGQNETILLSPACASFDQYKNFELRGEAFRQAVKKLSGVQLISSFPETQIPA